MPVGFENAGALAAAADPRPGGRGQMITARSAGKPPVRGSTVAGMFSGVSRRSFMAPNATLSTDFTADFNVARHGTFGYPGTAWR